MQWNKSVSRFDEFPVVIDHEPKFTLPADAKIFCIGSCFARNIEEHLIYNGLDVLSRRIISPKSEWAIRPNGIVNKFTTPSMLNEIEWAARPPTVTAEMFSVQAGLFHDLQLTPRAVGVSLERAIERRQYLSREYFSRVFDADAVVITLGLDECWFDSRTQLHLNAAPSYKAVRAEPKRYQVRALSFAQTLSALEAVRGKIMEAKPQARFVVTVSPVPLQTTFIGNDPAVSTMRAKSMLRTVAEVMAQAHDNVAYFPSYEMVMLSPRERAFQWDQIHVTDEVVGGVISRFVRLYLGRERVDDGFREDDYLYANPDVETLVRAGQYASGYEHWNMVGKGEGRPWVAMSDQVAGASPAA
jgi:hypothetical protein